MISAPRSLRWLALLAFCLVPAVGCNKSATTKAEDGPKVSKANFEKVKDGMSEADVEKILGTAARSNEVDPAKALKDVGGVMKDVGGFEVKISAPKMTVKQWDEGDTVYEVVFQDGKVKATGTSKKDDDKAARTPKVTKANYEKIKPGMKKGEVEAILGPGAIDESAKLQGFTGGVTVWKDGNNVIQIGFQDGAVVAMNGQFVN